MIRQGTSRQVRRLLGWAALAAFLSLGLLPAVAAGAAPAELTKGQKVYVPAYTHVYLDVKATRYKLTTTLVVHNTDLASPLQITSIKYYDDQGQLVKEYAAQPLSLDPLAALDVLVKEPKAGSGSGACFVVQWRAAKKISPPIIECIMIGAAGQQGISFRSTGRVIQELP